MIYLKKIIFILVLPIFLILTSVIVYKYITISLFSKVSILVFFTIFSLSIFIYFIFFTNEKYNNVDIKKAITLLDDNPTKIDKKRIKPIQNMIEEYPFLSSFSMALIGKWGSGKSSYLETLKEELKDKYEIISINVWQLENSENITNELKKELDNIIFRYNKKIWILQLFKRLFIQDYFSIVSKYLTKTPIKSSFTFEPTLKESKEKLHTQLTEALNGRKILLLVDELDRINSEDEILNIFKIIHYTNTFDNIFTITAMDIEQLENRLKNIDYIHKIFNLKYLLPLMDKNEIIKYYEDEIFDKLKGYIKENEFQEILKTSFIINAISNYRIIKNSFNDTIIFISQLEKEDSSDWNQYISFKFIFILNLIKSVDFKFYSYIVINKKIFTLLKISEIKDKENQTKIEQEKEFFEQEPLLEEIYKSLNFKKSLNLLSLIRLERNKEQSFDIYETHNIEKYHITDSRYESFISQPINFQNYFDEFHFDQDKSNFLLNILNRLSSNKKHQESLLSIVVNRIFSMQESILRKDYSHADNIYSFSKEIAFPHINLLADISFQHSKNKEIFLTLINKNTNLSDVFIKYLLENFLKNKEYQENCIKELLIKYIESLKEIDLDSKKYKLSSLIQIINSRSNTFTRISSRSILLYKIIYDYTQELNIDLSYTFLKWMYLADISNFIKGLRLDIDFFIKDDTEYVPMIGNSSQRIMGKELKEKIKESQQT